MSGSYGYVSAEGVGIDAAKLRFVTLLILIEVGHLGIDRNPLCVQVQVGLQNLGRIDCLFCALGVVWIGVPAAEGVAVRNGKHILENCIFLAGGSVFNGGRFNRAGDSAIVRVISYSNRNTGYIAVNMIAVFLILNGVPHDLDVVYVEVLAQNRGIGRAVIVGTVGPVVLIEETEFCRRNQIVGAKAVNVVDTVGRVIVGVRACGRNACLGERAGVTGTGALAIYAAVTIIVRQVICLALACAALRLTTVRQKYEILSRGQFRFRFDRGAVVNPLRVQSQVFVRHGFAFPLVLETCIGVPAAEVKTSLHNCRRGNRLIGIIRTFGGVRVVIARDGAVVQNVGQLVRIYVRLDINLDGRVVLGLDLVKVKTESVLAVYIGDSAQSRRVEFYAVDGVTLRLGLTNANGRNGEGLVVPELPGVENLAVIVAAINDDLIGYAAAIKILCLFLVNRPVGNVDLNHLRIFSANQIVEYQLVVPSECSPIGRILCTVL